MISFWAYLSLIVSIQTVMIGTEILLSRRSAAPPGGNGCPCTRRGI